MDEPHQILTLRGLISRLVPGIFVLVVTIWFYNWLVPNPIESLCLWAWGRRVEAELLDAYEDFQEEDAGPGYTFGIVVYEFITDNGKKITSSTRQLRGGLPAEWLHEETKTINIEYFPLFPRWNRIQGTGVDSFLDWLLQSLLGIFLLVLFLSPGVALLKGGIAEIRTALRQPREMKEVRLTAEEAHANRVWLFGWLLGIVAVFVFVGIGVLPLGSLILSLLILAIVAALYVWTRLRGP